MLAAVFTLLTDTPAKYAYNTAIAGYYAAYVAAAWGLAGAIAEGIGRRYRVAGGFAAFFVAVASNLSPPFRLLISLLPDPAGPRLAQLVSLEIRGLATGTDNFNYWFASRVIDWKVIGGDQWHLINEFPFFAFLNGDLHGHMMSPVFLLLGAGLAYSYWRTPASAVLRRRLLVFLTIPPVAGLLLVVNTWSFPAMIGIAWLALVFAPAPPWELLPRPLTAPLVRGAERAWKWRSGGRLSIARQETGRIGVALIIAAVLAALGALFALPFLTGPASGRGIGFLPEPRSDLPGLLMVHGAFLGIAVAYIARRTDRTQWAPVAVGLAGLLVVTWLFQATAVALFGPLLLVTWYLLRTREDIDYESVLLVGALGLLLLVEFVFVMEEAGPGRSNTVFKIYTQVWALWAVSAGAMASWFFAPPRTLAAVRAKATALRRKVATSKASSGGGSPARVESPSHWSHAGKGDNPDRDGGRILGTVLLAVLVVSLSIYAGFSLAWVVETGRDSPSLDSHDYIETRHGEEAAAIRWLNDLEGQPTIVSAPGVRIYQWVNGPASMTGIPTVAGWAHEIGYRGEEAYRDRVHDVRILYNTTEPESRAVLLDIYDVEYIYVGPIERERYDIQAYDTEPGISVAYQDANVTIYRVDQSAIAA
jgi:YYY domain-containing protein